MAQTKHGSKLYTLLFCIAVFFLTSLGLAVFAYGIFHFYIAIITFFYLTAWVTLFAFAVDYFGGKSKFSRKKILALTFGVMFASTIFTHSVWTIVTPSWSFSVSTDKPTYRLGEHVIITASLRNTGFITHSFKSASSSPVVIGVEYRGILGYPMGYQVYFSSINESVTEFSLGPSETLERSFSWNQTNTVIPQFWNYQTYMPGIYSVSALIPKDNAGPIGFDNLFLAGTTINVTST